MSSNIDDSSWHDNKFNVKKQIITTDILNIKKRWFEFETEPVWINIIFIITFHVLSLYFIVTFPYLNCKILFIWSLTVAAFAGLGVTAGAHRLWTHHTYKAKFPLQIILAILFATAGMNRIHDWVRDHRIHHKYTETNADPHNSKRGFWFAHVGWLFMRKHADVYKYGGKINMNDIRDDSVVCFVDKYFLIFKILFCYVIPVIIPVYLFKQNFMMSVISQIFIRYPLVLNGTWAVNSFAHMFGDRPYDPNIRSSENLGVALLSMGEGWHNYHHVFPWDYKASECGNIFTNPTTHFINFFAKIGWAYDLKEASRESIIKTIEKRSKINMMKNCVEKKNKKTFKQIGININNTVNHTNK